MCKEENKDIYITYVLYERTGESAECTHNSEQQDVGYDSVDCFVILLIDILSTDS